MSVVNLRDYIEAVLNEYRDGHRLQHEAEALAWMTFKEMWQRERTEALEGLNARLEKLNELRTEVLTDRGDFVLKAWYEAEQKLWSSRIEALESWRSRAVGAAVVVMLLSGGLGSVVTKLLGH